MDERQYELKKRLPADSSLDSVLQENRDRRISVLVSVPVGIGMKILKGELLDACFPEYIRLKTSEGCIETLYFACEYHAIIDIQNSETLLYYNDRIPIPYRLPQKLA